MGTELHMEALPKSIELVGESGQAVFRYIDERKLPGELVIEETQDWRVAVEAVKTLAVRGAPALGVTGAATFALWCQSSDSPEGMSRAAEEIALARPTAVNLSWGVRRALNCAELHVEQGATWEETVRALCELVHEMQAEDERVNRAIGDNGARLLKPGTRVLTHCNAGSLATCFYGTALGVVYSAAQQGKIERVYADETRPVGQGARLTVWELAQVGIPTTLICDDMAASLMASGEVDAVIVGADRIARNGDVANKIGTYGVAVLARHHGIPFYVAAPTSTIDETMSSGSEIVIEQRPASEVVAQPLAGVDVWNPAFDVTPAHLVTKIVTEKGVFDPQRVVG